MIKQAKFNLESLKAAGKEARERIAKWPVWKKEVVGFVSSNNGIPKARLLTDLKLEELYKNAKENINNNLSALKTFNSSHGIYIGEDIEQKPVSETYIKDLENLEASKSMIDNIKNYNKELYKRAESYYTLPEPNKISTDEMNKIVEEGREFSKEFDTMKKAIENLTEEDLHAKCGPTAIYNKEKTLIIGEHRSDDIIWRGIKLEYRGESDGYDQNYYYSSINDSIVDIDVVNTKSRYRNNVCLKFESTIYKTEIHNETIEGAFAKLDEELEEQAKQYAWLLRNFANG